MYFIMIYGNNDREPLIPYVIGNEHLDVIVATFPTFIAAKEAAEMNSFAAANGYEIFNMNNPADE